MSDVFIEHLIKRKKDKKDYLIIVLLIILSFILSFGFFFVGAMFIPDFMGVWSLLFAAIWYFAYIFISSRNVEFEYALTNSEFDIDKITAKRKRTNLVSLDIKKAEIVANINDTDHNRILKHKSSKVLDYTSNTDDKSNVYFIIVMIEGEKQIILFEPTSKMLENIYKFNPRNVFI